MAKKQIFTNAEIEKDVATSLRRPADMSEVTYKSMLLPSVIMACVFAVIAIMRPYLMFQLFFIFMAFTVCYTIFYYIRRRNKIKKISMSDYSVTIEIVHSTEEERYKAKKAGKWNGKETVINHNIRFENGKVWRIPKQNYLWCVEYPMSDFAIYQRTHRGDSMIVVTKNDTGDVVMAYNTDIFEYKD